MLAQHTRVRYSHSMRGKGIEKMTVCHDCRADVDPLEVFPRGRCLQCHANAPETVRALSALTAGGLARMWGAR